MINIRKKPIWYNRFKHIKNYIKKEKIPHTDQSLGDHLNESYIIKLVNRYSLQGINRSVIILLVLIMRVNIFNQKVNG